MISDSENKQKMSQATNLIHSQLLSGSYHPDDCLFLLTELEGQFTTIEEKERLIQSGQKHYSEMISFEEIPSASYQNLFLTLCERYKTRLAAEILGLAQLIMKQHGEGVTLVSLARAGTPFGALLNRALKYLKLKDSKHYSISIIRDRGIDQHALKFILRQACRKPENIIFLDTWTAKGVITKELKKAIAQWNQEEPETLYDTLYVVSDIGGTADFAATYDDYAIPSGVMNATVSGLMSRSILNEEIESTTFHGSVYYTHLEDYDYSQWFLDLVSNEFAKVTPAVIPTHLKEERYQLSQQWIAKWQEEFQIEDVNYIKPGIAEATRVMLRRIPACLILKDELDPDVQHLVLLAHEKKISILKRPFMPFKAVAFIKALKVNT